ncbi:MAG: Holliday junction branch migration protein RuvA [Clostridiales bacterium]|nr:Holliday junction branch migration protein RuvA [Clostridiales bacterium]
MISYIRGTLIAADTENIVVEAGQIGYHIRVPFSVISQLPSPGENVKIYTYMQVREDSLQLFGFLDQDGLQVFRLLLGVNGVGPKAALGVLSVMTPNDLRFAVASADAKAISKAPGLGAKTAQKIILELKDKLRLEDALENGLNGAVGVGRGSDGEAAGGNRSEAIQALVALGYSSREAAEAVRAVDKSEQMEIETLLKQALRYLALS